MAYRGDIWSVSVREGEPLEISFMMIFARMNHETIAWEHVMIRCADGLLFLGEVVKSHSEKEKRRAVRTVDFYLS